VWGACSKGLLIPEGTSPVSAPLRARLGSPGLRLGLGLACSAPLQSRLGSPGLRLGLGLVCSAPLQSRLGFPGLRLGLGLVCSAPLESRLGFPRLAPGARIGLFRSLTVAARFPRLAPGARIGLFHFLLVAVLIFRSLTVAALIFRLLTVAVLIFRLLTGAVLIFRSLTGAALIFRLFTGAALIFDFLPLRCGFLALGTMARRAAMLFHHEFGPIHDDIRGVVSTFGSGHSHRCHRGGRGGSDHRQHCRVAGGADDSLGGTGGRGAQVGAQRGACPLADGHRDDAARGLGRSAGRLGAMGFPALPDPLDAGDGGCIDDRVRGSRCRGLAVGIALWPGEGGVGGGSRVGRLGAGLGRWVSPV
jgi:hypothetical protein